MFVTGLAFAGEPLITLDYTGGYTVPRETKAPYLEIYEDGKIVARNPFSKDKPREGKMSKEALKKLVEEIRTKLVTPDAWPKDAPFISDASTTVIRVGKKNARQYALGFLARRYPRHQKIQALRAAAGRLDLIRNVTIVGGEKKAKALLATANKHLKKALPKAKPFPLSEMVAYSKGVNFRRYEKKRWITVGIVDGKVDVAKG